MGLQILTSRKLPPRVVLNAHGSAAAARTRVVFDQLLQGVELHAGGDVVAAAVQLADLVVFDVVAFGFLPVSDGEGISTWRRERRLLLVRLGEAGRNCGSCCFAGADLPLVVSLSRTRKVPRWFPGISSSLSASLRPIFPKYHLWRDETNAKAARLPVPVF